MAKNTFLDWDTTANNNTDVGGINIAENCPPSNINNGMRETMAQLRAGVDGKVVYAAKAGNYTALAVDNNAVHRYTATATVTLTAAATLGANWHYTVIADGAAVTIDPNGAETIDGAATLVIPDGYSATIICSGTAFFTDFGINHTPTDIISINGGPIGAFRNRVINGDFEVAKRATSTPAGTGFKYLTDRWARVGAGSTTAYAQQEFAAGVTMPPGNPRYYGRFTVVSVAGATNYAAIYHAMEDVRTLSGKTVTVTFYAKADASKNIGFELYQWFGLGGSPSSAVTGIGAQQCALTTSWQRFDILVAVPSISGKTRGTDNNDHLELVFWFDAGSTFASRASSIGQQSGTFDIAHVSIVEGDARQETDPFSARNYIQEEQLCRRYFQSYTDLIAAGYAAAGVQVFGEFPLSPPMREGNATPVFTLSGISYTNASALSLNSGTYQRARVTTVVTASGLGYARYNLSADFEI
ncbi:hypothetical protein [Rhizobium leguminosarum]